MADFWSDVNKSRQQQEENKKKSQFWTDRDNARLNGTVQRTSSRLSSAQTNAAQRIAEEREAAKLAAFQQSERDFAAKRAAQQAKRAEAIAQQKKQAEAAAEANKESGSGLKYVGESALLGLKTGWEDLKEGTIAQIKGITDSISEMVGKKQTSDGIVLPTLKTGTRPNAVSYADSVKYGLEDTSSAVKEAQSALRTGANKHLESTVASPETIAERAEEVEELRRKYSADELGSVAQVFADAAQSVGYMLPSQIASVIGTPVLGALVTANQGYASAYADARQNGASTQDASKYAALEAANQGALESVFGQFSDGFADVLLRKPLQKITKPLARTAVNWAMDTIGEGVEEVAQSLVTTANERLTYNKEAKIDPASLAYEGLLGGLMGGFYSAIAAPRNYRVYKKDIDIVNNIVEAAERVTSAEEAEAVRETGAAVIEQADSIINNPDADEEAKNSAEFVKTAYTEFLDVFNDNESIVIDTNTGILDSIEAIAESPAADIVENTARLVDTVADASEPGTNAVNTAIDIINQKIRDKQEEANEAETPQEQRQARIEAAALNEISSTLRNRREEVEAAREELPENNLTVPQRDDILINNEGNRSEQAEATEEKSEPAEEKSGLSMDYSVHTHTQTGAKQNVVRFPEKASNEDYNRVKDQLKKIGGYYSKFVKGFIIPDGSADDIAKNLAEIGITLNGTVQKTDNTAAEAESPAETVQAPAQPASLVFPDGLSAAQKTKFKRTFAKLAENEWNNITDMSSDRARMFASFASKLYTAGYNGVKPIRNYANLTDDELIAFPSFMQDTFYNLGAEAAAKNKPAADTDTAKKVMDELGIGGGAIVDVNDSGEAVVEEYTPGTAETLDKGDSIPDSGITMEEDGDDYSDEHQRVIDGYANAVDEEFLKFIDDSIDGKNAQNAVYPLHNITKKQADKIKEIIGVDALGWNVRIESRMINHIWKRHGIDGEANDSLKDTADIARMQYVIDNADDIEIGGRSEAYYEPNPNAPGKQRQASTVRYSKKINGTYYVIEAVPDAKKKTAFIVSAFIGNKKEESQPADTASDRHSPSVTSASTDAIAFENSSDNSIAQPAEKVKIPETEIADYVAGRLKAGLSVTTADMQVIANNAFGGTQAEGAYDVKSMTDAMELGVNEYLIKLISENPRDFNSSVAANAVESIREINEDILAKIPTQTKRSDEQISLQQFSTPPNIAYTAAWVANINGSDTVLEPSAGVGGLASFGKAYGADVVVNELSERRLALLRQLPFDGYYNENAEQIDNILPDSVKPTVVLMNPPFSSTGGRTKNTTKNAIPHIEQALLRLEDGGRLVAIVGRGMADDSPTFKSWWNELRNTYNIRANIGINGENYRKYGTTFDIQLVVIDKTGPQTGETITGYYDNLEKIPAILEGVRNGRTRTAETSQGAERNAAVESSGETGVESVSGGTRTDSGSGTDGVSGRSTESKQRSVERTDSERTERDGKSGIVAESETVQPESDIRVSDDSGRRGRLDGKITSETGAEQRSGGVDSRNSGSGASGQSERVVQSELTEEAPKNKPKSRKKASESDDGVYAEYKTADLTVSGTKKHPSKLVESAAMSAVSAPALTYKPTLDQKLISDGVLSDAQLENVCYAGQAHSQKLPNGQRKGYFIGDGTGVGKGRQISAIIMDNWNQGKKKAIWVSENINLVEDARRDWQDLGGDPKQIVDWKTAQKKGLPETGILFIPYSSLAGGATKTRTKTTLDTLADWFGRDFDGTLMFDEAHNMGNLIPMNGARGTKKPSQKAVAGDKLQSALPNACVTYASATGATNIENLSYAARLGLWGEGTAFRDASDFISKIARSGIAAMELVARDMKAMGVYLARSISYDGVVYDNLQHKLTADQRAMYNGMSEGWQVVLQNFDKAAQLTDSAESKEVKQRRGQIYGNMQLFYNQILTSMTMPTVIKDIEKQLAAGKSCVIQLVNTNEAAQDRAVSDAKSEGKTDLDDLDITPRQLLVGYVENAFPVEQYEQFIDENGNTQSRVVKDSSGQPVINRQAVQMKKELIAQLNEISIPEGPLDMLLNHFGAEQVAEITGRGGRVLNVTDENGNVHKQYVSRDAAKSNIAETKDFQDGRKRILVFSGAGATGRSFHSDRRAKNQQQRIHYVLQPGWRAETAVQGFGRTHRSNQANEPVFRLVSTDVMGHKRFVTSIARRLDQLGALTKGQRQTGSGVFGEKDNLESPLSAQALREFFRRLGENKIAGLNAQDVLGKMGLDKAFYDEFGRFTMNETVASDIPKFLNRLLALPVEQQNDVFTAFESIRDSFYEAALESGKLDQGLENVKADRVEIVQDDVIYTDPATGAETRYVKAKLYTKPTVIQTVEDAMGYRNGFTEIRTMQDGSVRAVYRIADQTDNFGRVLKRYALISPNTGKQSLYNENTLAAKTEAISRDKWESAWQEELKNVPEFNESETHMITGAILPVWNRLPETENVKARRIIASDGTQYLGRIIPKDSVETALRSLNVNGVKTKYTGKELYDSVMKSGKTVTMPGQYGGTLKITRRKVSGENRLEVSGSGASFLSSKYDGIFAETIQYERRYFIPTGEKGIAILDKMIADRGVRSVDNDDSEAFYSLGTSRGKWGKGAGDRNAKIKSIESLIQEAKRIFGVEINTGKVGKKGASGVYKTHAGTIRTRQYGDLPTIAHELGHWFDARYKLTNSPYVQSLVDHFREELTEAKYPESMFKAEAVANYFAEYLKSKKSAEANFKEFSRWLYETLSPADKRRLTDYAAMTNEYHSADLKRRAEAQVHTRTADNSFLSRAHLQIDSLKRNPSSYMGTLSRRFVRAMVDDLADLKMFGKSYELAMYEKTADSIAHGRITSAMTDRYGNVIGKSLAAILEKGNINDMNRNSFDAYLIANIALDRIEAAEKAPKGEPVASLVYGDMELQDKQKVIDLIQNYESDNPTFRDTANELYGYIDNLNALAVSSGLISQELYDSLKEKFPHYVPLFRVMDNDASGRSKRGYADQRAPIGRFKGSGRDIYSPIENIMYLTDKYTKACMRNDVMSEFADTIDRTEGMGWAAEKVPEAKIFDVISTDSIGAKLSSFKSDKLDSLTAEQTSELFGELMDFIGDYAGMWKPAAKQGRNVVSVMRDGKRQYYEIHDKDLYACLVNLDPRTNGPIMQMISYLTGKFKVWTTGSNPIFGVTNVQRDIASGFVSSTTTSNPVKYTADFFRAMYSAIRETDDYMEFRRNGGGWAGALTRDYKQLKHTEAEVIHTTNRLKATVNVISRAIPRLVDAGESASRYAEYRRARDQGIEALEAIRKSQEVTVNFARGGTITKEIDKVIPYFRASVNSMYHLFEVLTKGDEKELRAKWGKFIALNTIPATIGFMWRLVAAPALFDEDDDEIAEAYDSLSAYNKNAYWCFYRGNGEFIRIAKPKDMTVFCSVMERLTEYALLSEKDALYGLGEYILDSISPPTAQDATVFGSALSLAKNETFTGAPIVPTAYQYLDPELQYKGDTSAVAIMLGRMFNLSPMQIDFILEDNFGYIGTLITNLTRSDGDISFGFANKFTVDSVYSTDTANIFYDMKEMYESNASSYQHTGGSDEKYTLADVYGKYKYGKIADTYSALNKFMKAETNTDTAREMRKRMNAFLKAVNDTGMTDLDLAVIDIAEISGTAVADISPYVVVPSEVTYNQNKHKEKFALTFDEMLEYYTESQIALRGWYEEILASGYDEDAMADAMKDAKNEVAKQMRDNWEEKKFNQKYRS